LLEGRGGEAERSIFATDDFSALSLAILVAFRYMVQYVIYVVLIGAIAACIGGTTYLW